MMAQHWRSVLKVANSQGMLAQLGDMDTFFQFVDTRAFLLRLRTLPTART
jgi:hypothetical protein